MTDRPSTTNRLLDSTFNDANLSRYSSSAKKLLERWESGNEADLAMAVSSEPSLIEDRSVFLDLVQAEYRSKKSATSSHTPEGFCKRFSNLVPEDLAHSIYRLVEVEQYLSDNPDLFQLYGEQDWPSEEDYFGDFILKKEIGRGASARVYLAEQVSLDYRKVVVKVMQFSLDEASIAAKLSHENVVTIFSTGLDSETGLTWICMPYLGDKTIQMAIKESFESGKPNRATQFVKSSNERSNKTLTNQTYQDCIINLAKGIALGVSYIHSQNIYHGDLKPSNILLTDTGTPILIDFNLSHSHNFSSKHVGGTLPYMAPEQLQAIAQNLQEDFSTTIKTEVFAYGVILFEMLTGRHPYCNFTEPSNRQQSAESILELLSARNDWKPQLAKYDPVLRTLVLSCLSVDPQDRPNSFNEIIGTIEKLHSSFSIASRYVRRKPVTTVAAMTGVLLLASSCIAYYPSAWDYVTVKRADWMIASGEDRDATKLLGPYVEDHPEDLRALRRLANSLINAGKPEPAIDYFLQAWRLSRDPLDISMSSYSFNLKDGLSSPGAGYRMANEVDGFFNVAVNHNYARRIFSGIIKGEGNRHLSLEMEKLLVEAHRAAPNNQKIKMLMMKQALFNNNYGQDLPQSYTVPMILFEPEKACRRCCTLTLEFLSLVEKDEKEQLRIGFPYLKQLVAIQGLEEAESFDGKRLIDPYRSLKEFAKLSSIERIEEPPAPKSFLHPLDWCSKEDKSAYLEGLTWKELISN